MSQLPFTQLSDSLKYYEKTLSILDQTKPLSAELILEILLARDQVQTVLKDRNPIPKWSLLQLNQLDNFLNDNAKTIIDNIDLEHWRTLVNPSPSYWWWFLDKSPDKLNWLWNLLSISFLTISAGLVTNISTRFLIGNPDLLGSIAIIGQGVLTLITGKTALTLAGNEGTQHLLKRFQFIKYSWWNPLRCATTFVLMSGLLLFYFTLPKIAKIYTNCGVNDFKGQSSQWWLLCNPISFLFRVESQDSQDSQEGYAGEPRRLASAKNNFERAIQLDPNNMEAHFYLGYYYEKIGNLEKAQPEYEIAAHGGFLKAINNLSRLYILGQKYDKSIVLLKDSASLEKIRGTVMEYYLKKNLAWAYLESGDLTNAKNNLMWVFKLREKDKLKKQLSKDISPYCLHAILLEKEKTDPSQQRDNWLKCKDLNTLQKPEEIKWFKMADEKLKQGQQKKN